MTQPRTVTRDMPYGLSFSAVTTDNVIITDVDETYINQSDEWTVETLFFLGNVTDTNQNIWNLGSSSANRNSLTFDPTNGFGFQTYNGTSYTGKIIGTKNIGWYHAFCVRNASSVDFYLNNTISNTAGNNYAYSGNASQMYLGYPGGTVNGTQSLTGIITLHRVWSRALTHEETVDLRFENKVPQTNLVAEYLFKEGTGTVLTDTSDNANHGSITGATWTSNTPFNPR